MVEVKYIDWGTIAYEKAWKQQQELFFKALEARREDKEENYLVFCEHPHVYTLGKSGDEQNLLINHIQLMAAEATFHKVDRGGDITYHGFGQIVSYPILNLSCWKMGVKEYIHTIEESVIETLKAYGIEGGRLEGAIGVWIDVGKPNVRKICAIGVKVSRHITMHGLAFNINTDLKYFQYINPCGFIDKGVTSLAKELGRPIDIEEAKERLKDNMVKCFNMNLT